MADEKHAFSNDGLHLHGVEHCLEQLEQTLARVPQNPAVSSLYRLLSEAIKHTNARIDLLKTEQPAFNSLLFALLIHTSYNNPGPAERILELAKSYLHQTEPDNEKAALKVEEIAELMRKAMPSREG